MNPPAKGPEKRRRAFRKGHWAEMLAAWYLRLKCYRILHRRFKAKTGEIDLIAKRGKLIVFVEVKARADKSSAVNAVTFDNQMRISDAADIWISARPDANQLSFRFDIIAVMPWKVPVHFEDAF